MDNRLNLLRQHSAFWSKLGFCYDPVRLDEKGKPILFFDDFSKMIKYHRDFHDAGIKIHTSLLFSGWMGAGQFDYELTDRILDAVFSCGDDLQYIPRVKLNAPPGWCRANPEEVFVYENGPRDPDTISKLIGTERHDWLGYESPRGYYTAGGWKDDRPNIGGVISNQSFSSAKWLRDAGEALERLLVHLGAGPYGKRIPAIHIAYGISGETCVWGRFEPHRFGDWGIHNCRAFFDWRLNRYGDLEALRQAWQIPDLTRENTRPPSGALRQIAGGQPDDFFRLSPQYRITVDYERFTTFVNVGACRHFGRIVKSRSNKLTGVFYGYLLEVARSAYTGHLGLGELVVCPEIDFLCGPKSYYRNEPGEPGGELAPAQSINLHKLWLDEIDNRPHLANRPEDNGTKDFAGTRVWMWREFSKTLAHGSGMWWMDLGGGWYDSPEILAEVARIEQTALPLRQRERQSICEVLLVVDDESIYYQNLNFQLHRMLLMDTVRELNLCGAPVDMYLLRDLPTLDLTHYKMIVFLNINRDFPAPPCTAVYNYASGKRLKTIPCPAATELIPEGILAGTAAMKFTLGKDEFPFFAVESPEEVLARYSSGEIAAARTGREYHIALPILKAKHWRKIMEEARCRCPAPVNNTVYADNRFTAIFPKDNPNSFSFTIN